MGWTFSYTADKKGIIQDCLTGGESPKGFKVLAHSVIGNHLWVAFENETSERYPVGNRFRCLYLLAGGGRNMGWGCKAITEDMGPHDCDCPLYLLDLVPEPKDSDFSANFRARVRAYHTTKVEGLKKKAALKVGDTLILPKGCNPTSVEILSIDGRKVTGYANGVRYRIAPRFITNGTVVSL